MGSTRLPGKSLADLAGRPLLWHVLTRVLAARGVDRVVLATTTADRDGPLVPVAEALGVAVFRGSEDDVLDRYAGAAREHDAAVVVRITADNALADPEVIARTIDALGRAGAAYASNVEPRSFPKGLDVEVLTRDALEAAWREATDPSDREHVTPFIRRQPQRFPAANVSLPVDRSAWRWTVDEPADLDFVRRVYERLWRAERPVFGTSEVLALLEREPALVELCDRARAGTGVG
jgi:spore coat polysaccharide biosynthesis protein SpsF (cytidylyltransferase family)